MIKYNNNNSPSGIYFTTTTTNGVVQPQVQQANFILNMFLFEKALLYKHIIKFFMEFNLLLILVIIHFVGVFIIKTNLNTKKWMALTNLTFLFMAFFLYKLNKKSLIKLNFLKITIKKNWLGKKIYKPT